MFLAKMCKFIFCLTIFSLKYIIKPNLSKIIFKFKPNLSYIRYDSPNLSYKRYDLPKKKNKSSKVINLVAVADQRKSLPL